VVTGWWCGGKIDGHTFDDTVACHIDDGSGIAMAESTVPGFKVGRSGGV
jgi:hypothetical protein